MSYMGRKEDAMKDISSVEPYNDMQPSSPALMGASTPGPKNKAASGTFTLQRTKGSMAHSGDGVVRKME